MFNLLNFLVSITMPIVALYLGSHLNKRNDNIKLMEKRFKLYKPLYFELCIVTINLQKSKAKIKHLHYQMTTSKEHYLLIDSKTRKHLKKLFTNTKTNEPDIEIIDSWDKKTFNKKTRNLKNSLYREFIDIQYILGYPVSPLKHAISNISFLVMIISFSSMINIGSFGTLVNDDINTVAIYFSFFSLSFIISTIYFIVRRHYFTDY